MFASDDPGSPQRELDVRPPVERPAGSRMDAQWPLAIQPGDAGRRCNQMALFSTCRLRAIDQPARPDALATGGPVVEQTKPLRPPSTPWVDEQRPRSAHRRRQTPGWGGLMRTCKGKSTLSAPPPPAPHALASEHARPSRSIHAPTSRRPRSHVAFGPQLARPSSASARITRSTSPTSSGSSAEVGSSNSITFGRMASARAIAARCCCPPERWAG
jgi:hypothetical protein